MQIGKLYNELKKNKTVFEIFTTGHPRNTKTATRNGKIAKEEK